MIHRLAEKIVTGQIRKGTMQEKERNKYIYAYEVFLDQVFNFAIAFVLGIVTHELLAVCVFLAIYIPLRKYAGGFHAKTNGRCMVYSTLVIVGVILCNKVGTGFVTGVWVLAVLSGISVILLVVVEALTPVEAVNKKLTKEEKLRCRKKVSLFGAIHTACMAANLVWMRMDFLVIDFLFAYLVLTGVLVAGDMVNKKSQ